MTAVAVAGQHPGFADEGAYSHLERTLGNRRESTPMRIGVDLGGTKIMDTNLIKQKINEYGEKEDWERVVKLYETLTKDKERKKVENWINLAKLYAQTGNNTKAIEAAEQAMKIDPSIRQYAEEFISSMK